MQPDRLNSKRLMSEILSIPQHQEDNMMDSSSPTTDVDRPVVPMDPDNETSPPRFCSRSDVVLLDCQTPPDFHQCHIRGAVNVTFSSLLLRRIAAGKIDLFDKSKELKAKMANTKFIFIVYDSTISPPSSSANGEIQGNGDLSDLVSMVAKILAQNGCRVATLVGGLNEFRELYPEWVETNETNLSSSTHCSSSSSSRSSSSPRTCNDEPNEIPLLGLSSLASLRIQDETDNCDSCISLDADDSFPVEIIPYLYLGNSTISSDAAALEKYNIRHILNVTPDLPNHFENEIRYMKIPISDHWTQSMFNYFPSAITFIDEGRNKEEGVLVHCLAGISRSVTITMAYIMFKMGLSLNEAYDVVRARKSNISPNFHFMGQLLDFERQLHSQFLSPAALGSSPDSGIEFDRWNNT